MTPYQTKLFALRAELRIMEARKREAGSKLYDAETRVHRSKEHLANCAQRYDEIEKQIADLKGLMK